MSEKIKNKHILNVLSQRVDEICIEMLKAATSDSKTELLHLISELGARNQTMSNALVDGNKEAALEAVSVSSAEFSKQVKKDAPANLKETIDDIISKIDEAISDDKKKKKSPKITEVNPEDLPDEVREALKAFGKSL